MADQYKTPYRVETLAKEKIKVIDSGKYKGETMVSDSAIDIIFFDDKIIIDFGEEARLHLENRYVDRLINLLTMHKKRIRNKGGL